MFLKVYNNCTGVWDNGICINKAKNVPCSGNGTVNGNNICVCNKGYSGRDCSIQGCSGMVSNMSDMTANTTLCDKGTIDTTKCTCSCNGNFTGPQCNIRSGVSSKSDCATYKNSMWTGQRCIDISAGIPIRPASGAVHACYEDMGSQYFYVNDTTSPNPYQCYLGDRSMGTLGDSTSFYPNQLCFGGSASNCQDILKALG